MTTQDLKIGQTVYLINEYGRVWEKSIIKIFTNSFVIENAYKENRGGDEIEINTPYAYVVTSYNKSEKIFYCFSEHDAAIYKKEAIVNLINSRIKLVETNYNELKQIRAKYYDLLNTKDIDKWVLDFKNNNNW